MDIKTTNKKYKPISLKLLGGVLLISSFLTLLTTGFQLYSDYRTEIGELEKKSLQIQNSYLTAISNVLWTYNQQQLEISINGIAALQDVIRVEIWENDQLLTSRGTLSENTSIEKKEYPLIHQEKKNIHALGFLRVFFSLDRINKKITDKIVITLIMQTFKTFLSSLLILIMVNLILTKYLKRMYQFFRTYDSDNKSIMRLDLNKKSYIRDEVDYLAESINHMVDNLNELYENMEKKIQERTKQLKQKSREVQKMLETMEQGVFTINKDKTIHTEYSKFLERIFETQEIAGKDAIRFLFASSSVSRDGLNQMISALDFILDEPAMNFEFNYHLFEKEFIKHFPGGRQKFLSVAWTPVIFKNTVEKILVVVRDETQMRSIQAEQIANQKEWQLLTNIIQIGPTRFYNFCHTLLDDMKSSKSIIIEKTHDYASMVILRRIVHTVKGNARMYGFKDLSDSIHQIEDLIDKQNLTLEEKNERILQQITLIENSVLDQIKFQKEKLAFKERNHNGTIELEDRLLNLNLNSERNLVEIQEVLWSKFYHLVSHDIDEVIRPILAHLTQISTMLSKINPTIVTLGDKHVRFNLRFSKLLSDVLVHCFRNSIDHGIEKPQERVLKGKSTRGKIFIDLIENKNEVILELYDDGRGLNLELIAKKKKILFPENETRMNLDNDNHRILLNAIFETGFTTAEHVSTISGRGMGMDAVKNLLAENQSFISIVPMGPVKNGFLPFKFVIEISKINVVPEIRNFQSSYHRIAS